MQRELQGTYLTLGKTHKAQADTERVRAFVPYPLPPNPPIQWTSELQERFHQALLALGWLNGAVDFIPNIDLYIYMYVRKEAVLSSMIEGTQSSLSDLLLFEINESPGVPLSDVLEVSNYVKGLNVGLNLLKEGLPVSTRLLKQIHRELMSKSGEQYKFPGEFRQTQNWIGGTRPGNAVFVPPPHGEVGGCMGSLEKFINDMPEKTPALLKAALAHLQFETIHPFVDGNGRVGRMLITLILREAGILKEPILHLSLYFKIHRRQYYEMLSLVRETGDWETWLNFFAEAVIRVSIQMIDDIKRIRKLIETDRAKIQSLGQSAASALQIYDAFVDFPIANMRKMADKTSLSQGTIYGSIEKLERLGILKETTGQRRNRIFLYAEYLGILEEGTESIDH